MGRKTNLSGHDMMSMIERHLCLTKDLFSNKLCGLLNNFTKAKTDLIR